MIYNSSAFFLIYCVFSVIGLFFISLNFFLVAMLCLCVIGIFEIYITKFIQLPSAYFVADIELKEKDLTTKEK